jgi:hypothetical protein
MTSLLEIDRLFEMKGEFSSAPMRAPLGAAKTFCPYDPPSRFSCRPRARHARGRVEHAPNRHHLERPR